MKLNPAQTAAACHGGGPALVLAGPGSGKTTVLAGRVIHLIETGIRPSSILVVTFTRAAAKEMEARFLQRCPYRGEGVTFSTCHSLFFRIIRRECGYTGQDILSEKERQRILREVLRKHGIEAGEDTLRYVASDISRVKNTALTGHNGSRQSVKPVSSRQYLSAVGCPHPDAAAVVSGTEQSAAEQTEYPVPDPFAVSWCTAEKFRHIYEAYNGSLRRSRRIEFDDMPLLCLELFEQSPEVLHRWQQVWSYFLIDEFQDTNPVQNRLLCLLAQPQDHFFAVGDEDQSIYAFRGATPRMILDFAQDHPGAKQYLLDTNYRCCEEIITASRQLIGENVQRVPREIHGTGRDGGCVQVIPAADQRQEAQMIAADIRRHLSDGDSPEEIAVLYRNHGAVQYLTHALSQQMIPYRMKQQAQDIYAHWITKDIFAYFSLALNRESRADLLRILNRPQRYLPRELFTGTGLKWQDYERLLTPEEADVLQKLGRDLDRVARFTPYAALHYIIEGIGYADVLKQHALSQQIPAEELNEVTDFLLAEAAGYETFSEWKEAVGARRARHAQAASERQDGVLLSTIHGVKGLEFDTVYLLDVNETMLPMQSAMTCSQVEEERRLCYVAMTRARKELKLYVLSRYHAHNLQPSRFLAEAGLLEQGTG